MSYIFDQMNKIKYSTVVAFIICFICFHEIPEIYKFEYND
jgi:hypothetical protein